jgi:GNAT superfamily N-acetyltransferase
MISYFNKKDDIIAQSKVCLDNELFLPDGSLRNWYFQTIDGLDVIEHLFVYSLPPTVNVDEQWDGKSHKSLTPVGVFAVKSDKHSYHIRGTKGNTYFVNCGTYVKTDYRKQKIGSALVNAAKMRQLEVYPWMDSERAEAFYKNLGYKEKMKTRLKEINDLLK